VQLRLGRQRRARAIENLEQSAFFFRGLLGRPLLRTITEHLREPDYISLTIVDGSDLSCGPELLSALSNAPPFFASATA
jgi:hypothetical protein